MFFAKTQNKLLYAVTHQTAAELIVARADVYQPNMGLTTWKGSIVRKGDVIIAKNYLQNNEYPYAPYLLLSCALPCIVDSHTYHPLKRKT